MSTDAVRAALAELVRNFPTVTDLIEAGWLPHEIDAAMNAYDAARAALSEPAPEFCCKHSWSAAMQLAWKERDTNCNCDHNEYCGKCWPLEFREGGKWHKYAAAPSPTIPAGQTRSQKLTAAGFTRRPSLWAREAREALELIAAPMRPDGTWNRDREACRQLAAEALGRSEDTPTPLTERIVYPKIPPRKIQDDDEQPAPPEPEPSPEVVEAYLRANEEYWRRIDDEPMKLGKWRNGTVQEATAYALRTAIAAEREHQQNNADNMRQQIADLRAENFKLAAGQCVNATADDGGTPYCAELSTLRQHLAEAGRDGWTDAEADAARLALELECLLTDKDVPMPALSRWWDSAHEALELHRARFRTAIAAQGEANPPGVELELFEGE